MQNIKKSLHIIRSKKNKTVSKDFMNWLVSMIQGQKKKMTFITLKFITTIKCFKNNPQKEHSQKYQSFRLFIKQHNKKNRD